VRATVERRRCVWSCVYNGAAAVWPLHRGWRRCTGSRHTLSEICSSICLSCASVSASRSWLRCAIISTMSSSLRACVRAGHVSRRRRASCQRVSPHLVGLDERDAVEPLLGLRSHETCQHFLPLTLLLLLLLVRILCVLRGHATAGSTALHLRELLSCYPRVRESGHEINGLFAVRSQRADTQTDIEAGNRNRWA
jgi:hypothetical protein